MRESKTDNFASWFDACAGCEVWFVRLIDIERDEGYLLRVDWVELSIRIVRFYLTFYGLDVYQYFTSEIPI